MPKSAALICLLLAGLASLTQAQVYSAYLDSENQTPPIDGFTGYGECSLFRLNTSTWGWNVTVFDIPDWTLAHFHYGNATTAGPIVLPLVMNAVPLSITGEAAAASTFTPKNFTNTLKGKTFAALEHAIAEDLIYCNVHTTQYPEGAIRGQVA